MLKQISLFLLLLLSILLQLFVNWLYEYIFSSEDYIYGGGSMFMWIIWDISSISVICASILFIWNADVLNKFNHKTILILLNIPWLIGSVYWLLIDMEVLDMEVLDFPIIDVFCIRGGAILFSIGLLVLPLKTLYKKFALLPSISLLILIYKLILDVDYYFFDYLDFEEDESLKNADEQFKDNEESKLSFYEYPKPIYHSVACLIYFIYYTCTLKNRDDG